MKKLFVLVSIFFLIFIINSCEKKQANGKKAQNAKVVTSELTKKKTEKELISASKTGIKDNLILGIMDVHDMPNIGYEDGKLIGVQPDIVREVAKRAGIKIKLKRLPWKRIISYVKEGLLDGSALGYKTEDRKQFGIYTDIPTNYNYFCYFVKKGKEFPFEKLEDLYNKRIAKQMGFHFDPSFDQVVKRGKITLNEVNSQESLFIMLKKGRVDAIAAVGVTAKYFIKKSGFSDIVSLPQSNLP